MINSSEEDKEIVASNDAGEAAYEKTVISPTPLDPVIAAEILKEVKRILMTKASYFGSVQVPVLVA